MESLVNGMFGVIMLHKAIRKTGWISGRNSNIILMPYNDVSQLYHY